MLAIVLFPFAREALTDDRHLPITMLLRFRSPPPSSASAAVDLKQIAGANQSSSPIRRAARLPPAIVSTKCRSIYCSVE